MVNNRGAQQPRDGALLSGVRLPLAKITALKRAKTALRMRAIKPRRDPAGVVLLFVDILFLRGRYTSGDRYIILITYKSN